MSPAPAKLNPFPGLRPFTREEDYLFFGREEQTLELLQRLGSNRFVAVVGTSGSGKSSLVRCGLLSEVLGGRMLGAGASWEIAVTHPGGNPLALLADALLEADLYDRGAEHARENLLATLSRSHFGLVEAVKQADIGKDTNFLLVVDQFEEIFRFHEAGQTQQEAANEFVSLLLEAAAQKEVPIYIVLTMRSDFIGECGQFEGLAETVNRGEFLIPRLTREQYKRVIEGPIKVAGGQIAPRLLQRLLNDLGQQADQLPCLQHALMRTWTVWSEKGDTDALDLDDYQRVGRMSQALSLHADEIYESFSSDRQRDLCQGMFQALTVEESNNRGIRRPQRLGRLCQILEVEADELRPIIDAYRQSGVTFLMPSPEVELTDQTIIDISHESLMRVWTRLRQWVEEETQAAGIYHRLSESAALHEQGQAGLFRDPELGIALAWRESKRPNAAWAERYRPGFATAMRFLEASQQASVAEEQAREAARQRELEQAQQLAEARQLRLVQQHRAARKLRRLVAGLAVVAVIAAIAFVAALVARNQAGKLAQIAAAEAEKARNNAKRAEQSQQETQQALTQVESQKAEAERNLTKAIEAEQFAQAAEEAGRKLLYTTDMRLAPFVWADNRTTAQQLHALLATHDPDDKVTGSNAAPPAVKKSDLRGFEWQYYQHLLESSAAVFSGHSVAVAGSSFTSDGQLVTLDQNAQVRHWNVESQNEDEASRRDLTAGPSPQARILSPDGKLAALAQGNKVHVFDTTGQEHCQIDSAQGQFRRLIFTPDSSRLVIVDDKIRWCNAGSGAVIASFGQGFNNAACLALSADGLTLAVIGHGQSHQLYSMFRLDPAAQTVTPQGADLGTVGTMGAAAMSPDGTLIAVNYPAAGYVNVLDTPTGRRIAQHVSAHASPVSALTFSADGTKLVTADVEGTIKIWEDARKLTSKSAAFLTLKGHEAAIRHVGFSPTGKQLVSTSDDKTARVWDMDQTGAAIRALEQAGTLSYVARFSLDGNLIAAADGSTVRLWDAATGKLVRLLSVGDRTRVHGVEFSPTDHRLLAVGYGGQPDVSHVVLWDIDAGTEIARLPGAIDVPDARMDGRTNMVSALAFSPDGQYLVAGFGSGTFFSPAPSPYPLKVWEVATHRLIHLLIGHTGACPSLDFSPDGKLLASGSHDGTAILWSTESWKAIQTLRNPDRGWQFSQAEMEVAGVAFAPDGKTLALASRGGTIQFWDVPTGKLRETLKGHSNAVHAVEFSPDGRTLASGSTDQTVRLWNVETQRELMQLESGKVELRGVESLAFSPDGKHLLAGGGSTAFWSTAPPLWNDPEQAAEKLRLLLSSNADFQSRICMLSENLRLHAALAKLNSDDVRLQAALAATQANWHASRQAWPEASAAFDRLVAADPTAPDAWLRTPGLLRIATALLHQDRPRDAAALLKGGAKRRAADGLLAAADRVALGMVHMTVDGQARVTEVLPGSPAARSALLAGDLILKVNDTELTQESASRLTQMLAGQAGTKIRLTVRHRGSEKSEVIELTLEKFINDSATGAQLHSLRTAINERLAQDPGHAGLLELRAELAGQWSGTQDQLADYTASIAALSQQSSEPAADLQRLYGRRASAHVAVRQWQQAIDDYAHVITDATTDVDWLAQRASAYEALKNWDAAIADWSRAAAGNREEIILRAELAHRLAAGGQVGLANVQFEKAQSLYERSLGANPDDSLVATELVQLLLKKIDNANSACWTVLQPTEMKSEGGATLTLQSDGSVLASGTNPGRDAYTLFAKTDLDQITAIRLEALPDPSLPNNGPGRSVDGNFHLNELRVFSGGRPVTLADIVVDRDVQGGSRNVIDGRLDATDGWSNFLWPGKTNTAIIATRADRAPGDDLKIELYCSRRINLCNLGRFRLSASADLAIAKWMQQRLAIQRAADLWSKLAAAYAVNGRHEEASRYFGKALQRADGYEGRKPILELAAQFDGLVSGLAEQQPDDWQLLLALARERAERGKQRLAEKQPDAALAELQISREIFTRLRAEPQWTVLTPVEMQTETGGKMELQEDGSVFVYQPTKNESHSLVFQTELKGIKGLRLETLADSRLPSGGPGWHVDGSFILSELSLQAAPAKSPSQLKSIALRNASADFSQVGGIRYDVRSAVDSHDGTGWAIMPQTNKDHTAVFELAEEVGDGQSTRLTVRLKHDKRQEKVLLGRFRLSITTDAATLPATRVRLSLKDSELLDFYVAFGKSCAQLGQSDEAVAAFKQAFVLAKDRTSKARIISAAAPLAGALEKLAESAPSDVEFQAELARHHAERGDISLAGPARTNARALLEDKLAKEPENADSQQLLADLVLGSVPTNWSILQPTEMKSEGGATLTLLDDQSILASGKNPPGDRYSITAVIPASTTIQSIRLEALAHESLVDWGPGRARSGVFAMIKWDVTVVRPHVATPQSLTFQQVIADHEYARYPARPQGGWNITGSKGGDDHAAIWTLPEPVTLEAGTKLNFDIEFNRSVGFTDQNLGRFRLSTLSGPLASRPEGQQLAALKLTDPKAKLAAAFILSGEPQRAADLLAKLPAKAKDVMVACLGGGASFDRLLDLLQDRAPLVYAGVLPDVASAAAERGALDSAQVLYTRLATLQPDSGRWKERAAQIQPGTLAIWNFDTGLDRWGNAKNCQLSASEGVLTSRPTAADPQISTPVNAPAGGKALALRYRTKQAFTLQVFWSDASGAFSEFRRLDYRLPASAGAWRDVVLPFECPVAFSALRLDPETGTTNLLEIDSLALRHLEADEYRPLAAEVLIEPELARLTKEIAASPTTAARHSARGNYLAQLGRWRQAAGDFEQERKLAPTSRLAYFKVATCLLLAGDESGYRQHCRAMVEQFHETSDAQIADSVCKTCLLYPGAIELSELPIQLLRSATSDPKHASIRTWFVACCALYSYREGNHEEAIAWTEKNASPTGQSGALALVVLALAEQQLGRRDQARQTLARAEAIIPAQLRTLGTAEDLGLLPVPFSIVAQDWLAPEILRREAAKLIVPDGKSSPRR